MKDIVISQKRVRTELFVLLGCAVAAELLNVYAIVSFDRPWIELVSTIGYVIVVALVLYLITALLRIVVRLVACLLSIIKHSITKNKE